MNKLNIVLMIAVVFGAPRAALADDPGYSLSFDGVSDFVRLSATSSMMASGWRTAKTVSLWVKPTGSATCTGQSPNLCDTIFGDRPRSWGISRGSVGGSDRIWVWNYDGGLDSIGIEYTVGEWTHIALVHGGSALSAYKNGVLVGSVLSGATPEFPGQVLHFGGIINNASLNWTFQGEIDELQVWNGARTAAEISQDWNRTLTGSEDGLAAYYGMSNGLGTSVTDDSGHLWSGTLNDGGSGVAPDGPIAWVSSGAFGGGGGTTNTPPVADAQDVTTAEDTPVAIGLTGSDVDGNPITFRVVSQPSHGTLSGTAPGLSYAPSANFHGVDVFTFVVNDGHVDSAVATVSLTVTSINDPPTAVDDAVSTVVDTPVLAGVLSNDVDVDGDALTITEVGNPSNGTVFNNVDAVTYTPNPGFTGTDSFSYTISDGDGNVSSAEVTVAVTSVDDRGYALRFDGQSDYVTLPYTSYMLAPGWQSTKTVELWVRPTGSSFCDYQTAPHCDAIFGDRPRWWGISRGVIGGLDRIWVWNIALGRYSVIGIDYLPGEWVHIAMVQGGGTLSAYKNGALVGTVVAGATQQPSTGGLPVLQIGGIINNAERNWTFSGDIDEVRLWNTARTGEEINQGMNLVLDGTETDLAAYYKMSDGAGLSLTDDSNHGWTGTLHDGGNGVPADGPILWVEP